MMNTSTDVYNPGSQPVQNPVSSVFNPNQDHLQLSSVLRTCSVRGCSQPLLSESTNKMCEACRSRHRVYASTKRAKRKLEKAAVASIRRVGDQFEVCGVNNSLQAQVAWPQPQSTPSQSSATANENASTTWDNSAIDPQLFTEQTATSIHHHSIVTAFSQPPYPSSSSSELAGALTLPPSSSRNTSTTTPDPNSYSQLHAAEKTDNNYSTVGLEVALSLQPVRNAELDRIVDGVPGEMGAQKPCSVKGCKAMIPYSSTYKMCTPCRTRYRTYGTTKRAKWRAEREAFDLELVGLKTKEDTEPKTPGEPSLPGTPEGLHQWELPLVGEISQSISENGFTVNQGISSDDTMIMQSTLYPNGSSTDGRAYTPMSGDASFPLPARMCTVSHCHKILPGFYRYKRCAQHRLQNRYHSHLKRIREKGEKAILLENVSAQEGGSGSSLSTAGDETNWAEQESEDVSPTDDQAKSGSEEVEQQPKSGKKKPRKRPSTCLTNSCCNLLAPGVCWLYCDVCRAIKRVYRREERALKEHLGQGGDPERLKEITGIMEASGIDSRTRREREKSTTAEGEEQNVKVPGRRGKAGRKKTGDQVKVAPMTTAPLIRSNAPAPTSPQAAGSTDPDAPGPSTVIGTETNDHTTTPYPQAFQSVFRADITALPPPSADMDRTPTTTTFITTVANPVNPNTDGGQLTIREYRPKTRVGGGPILSQGAEAFREMVQKEQQTTHGVIGPPSYHVYRSTPPPFRPISTSVTTASEPESTATTSLIIVDDPLSEKARAQPQERLDANPSVQNSSKSTDTSGGESSNPLAINTIDTGQELGSNGGPPPTTITSSPPPSPAVARQRKPRAPRAKPIPQVPTIPTPATSSYPYSSSSQYPYPYSYPYPYYLPPYAYSMPRMAPSMSSTIPHPSYPYSYPYHYPYTSSHGAYPPGYGYMQSPQRYPLGSYPPHHQPSMSLLSQQQSYAPASPYAYMHSKSAPYYQPPLPVAGAPPSEAQNKRRREESNDEQDSSMVDHSAPIGRLSPPAPIVQPQSTGNNTPNTALATPLVETAPTSAGNTGASNSATVGTSEQSSAISASPPHAAIRICAHRACHRTIPADHIGNLCERCRVRIKRHQAKTKERLKLEPRKSIFIGKLKASTPVSSVSAEVA